MVTIVIFCVGVVILVSPFCRVHWSDRQIVVGDINVQTVTSLIVRVDGNLVTVTV